jgi:putative flippase GtrA
MERTTTDRTDRDAANRSATGAPRLAGQVGRFVSIGMVSTAAYLVLYGGLRTMLTAVASNAIALFVTAVWNTAANRRLTFGVHGRASMVRDQIAGLGAFAIALVITTGAVIVLAVVAPRTSRWLEIGVVVAANVVATIVRFLLLRAAIAPGRRGPAQPTTERFEVTAS